MKFECGDLERALANSELMPEAREHLKGCAACRREYWLWNEISSSAKQMHTEWESPELWPDIRTVLAAEPKPKFPAPWQRSVKIWAVAAVALIAAGLSVWAWLARVQEKPKTASAAVNVTAGNRDFLTDQALQEVERTEAAYRQSIARLSRLAEPQLRNTSSPVAVNCREKLALLDSAISDTQANLDQNRYNVQLRTELADLYREKQETLKELLTRDRKN